MTELRPNEGWVPIDVVADWLTEELNGRFCPISLIRADGLYERGPVKRPAPARARHRCLPRVAQPDPPRSPPKRSSWTAVAAQPRNKLAEEVPR
ncbi:MAG: hypothetical protein IPK80_16055 [Nannocystis sp.]|nr:hypothetical protein [Nannocystis sp.]